MKEYLGDAVYAEYEAGELRLWTTNGIEVTNEIFLEPEVFAALLQFHKKASEAVRTEQRSTTEPPKTSENAERSDLRRELLDWVTSSGKWWGKGLGWSPSTPAIPKLVDSLVSLVETHAQSVVSKQQPMVDPIALVFEMIGNACAEEELKAEQAHEDGEAAGARRCLRRVAGLREGWLSARAENAKAKP